MTTTGYWRGKQYPDKAEFYIVPGDEGFNGLDGKWHPTSALESATPEELAAWGVTRCNVTGEALDPDFYETTFSAVGRNVTIINKPRDKVEVLRIQERKLNAIIDQLPKDVGPEAQAIRDEAIRKMTKAETIEELQAAKPCPIVAAAQVESLLDRRQKIGLSALREEARLAAERIDSKG